MDIHGRADRFTCIGMGIYLQTQQQTERVTCLDILGRAERGTDMGIRLDREYISGHKMSEKFYRNGYTAGLGIYWQTKHRVERFTGIGI